MLSTPNIPESAYVFVWAGLLLMAIVALLAGYRKWQSESSVLVLSSKEYAAERAALLETVKRTIADEAHQTRELLSVKIDAVGVSIDRVERNAASKADLATLKGRVGSLEAINQVFHGVQRPSDSGSMPKATA